MSRPDSRQLGLIEGDRFGNAAVARVTNLQLQVTLLQQSVADDLERIVEHGLGKTLAPGSTGAELFGKPQLHLVIGRQRTIRPDNVGLTQNIFVHNGSFPNSMRAETDPDRHCA